ncbi:unnamed protein product [Gordionus sp. m RMFG-2023]|uniref:homeobox-like protein HDP1 n=1 Tax=Gordionus sp. m RMFG-2023 TaxID=3053472 RepID=UPI0030DFA2AE
MDNKIQESDNENIKRNGTIPLLLSVATVNSNMIVHSNTTTKKSYFQITSVHEDIAPTHVHNEKSEDNENLDESETKGGFTIDNTAIKYEGNIIEVSKQYHQLPITFIAQIISTQSISQITSNTNKQPIAPPPNIITIVTNSQTSFSSIKPSVPRFKVVKIPSQIPYKKGRWICTDGTYISLQSSHTSQAVASQHITIVMSSLSNVPLSVLPSTSTINTNVNFTQVNQFLNINNTLKQLNKLPSNITPNTNDLNRPITPSLLGAVLSVNNTILITENTDFDRNRSVTNKFSAYIQGDPSINTLNDNKIYKNAQIPLNVIHNEPFNVKNNHLHDFNQIINQSNTENQGGLGKNKVFLVTNINDNVNNPLDKQSILVSPTHGNEDQTAELLKSSISDVTNFLYPANSMDITDNSISIAINNVNNNNDVNSFPYSPNSILATFASNGGEEVHWKHNKLFDDSVNNEKFSGSLEELATSNTQAIDNKIELAMDLVKSHLRLAVKSEMDYLRERVKDLTEINDNLRTENSFLRSHFSVTAEDNDNNPRIGDDTFTPFTSSNDTLTGEESSYLLNKKMPNNTYVTYLENNNTISDSYINKNSNLISSEHFESDNDKNQNSDRSSMMPNHVANSIDNQTNQLNQSIAFKEFVADKYPHRPNQIDDFYSQKNNTTLSYSSAYSNPISSIPLKHVNYSKIKNNNHYLSTKKNDIGNNNNKASNHMLNDIHSNEFTNHEFNE